MLNPFPIQFLAMVAYALLRVTIGIVLMHLGLEHIRNRQTLKEVFSFSWFPYGLFFAWYVGVFEIIVATMFILGFLTQIAALLTILLSLKFIIMHKRFSSPSIPGKIVYLLLLGISLSLFITGAGIFAFDLPI